MSVYVLKVSILIFAKLIMIFNKTQTLQYFEKSSTNGDVERPEKLTKSNNQAINIIKSKEGTYTLSWIN